MKKMRKAGNQKCEEGFTLLEILIAIFIFTLIVSAIFTAYRGTFNIIENTESQENIYHMARVTLDRMTRDLEAAYFPESTQNPETDQTAPDVGIFQGEKKEINDLPCGELRFSSLAHLTFSDEKALAEPAEIFYYAVATGTKKDLLDLYRSDTSLTRGRPESVTGGLLLCKGLSSIDLMYYDAEGEAHESWDSVESGSKGKPPSRVSILLEFPNSTDPERPFKFMTGVAIPMGG